MHQRVHEVSINAAEHYVMIRCDEEITIYDEIPYFCATCGEAL